MPIGYYDPTANGGSGCYIDYSTSQCTPLDATGSGDYNGSTYYNGEQANGFFSSIPNSSYWNTYFIWGSPTTLDSNGNGSWNGTYYLAGSVTTLDSCGNGYYNGSYYVDGSVSSSAWSPCASQYIYNGSSQSGVDSSGNGYSSSSNAYFIAGTPTTLDSNGSGFWNNHAYSVGSLQPNGWNGYYWYINDVQTTLDSSGNGTWNGITYSAGVAQIIGTKFVGSPGDSNWDTVTNWTDDLGNVATTLPDGNSPITVLAYTNGYNMVGPTTFPNVTVSGAFSFPMSITVQTGGTAVFKNGASLPSTGSIMGDVEFRDTAYMDNGAYISGTVTFKGNSVNKSGITGTVIGAHGGGINGSNILGFA